MIDHTRHLGIFDASSWPVTLIGAGGIGAITAITLAKMGVPDIVVFDDDEVDTVNLATQFYREDDLSTPKVEALGYLVSDFAGDTLLEPVQTRVSPAMTASDLEYLQNPIVISAVDSIKSRQAIWEVVRKLPWLWYLDARMGAENFLMYAVYSHDRRWYERALLAQRETDVPNLPCTAKATIYTGAIAAGHIGAAVRKIVMSEELPRVLSHDIYNNILSTVGA